MRPFEGDIWPWNLDILGEGADWCCLRDATGGFVSDARVEGTRAEFKALAVALRAGVTEGFRRCAVMRYSHEYKVYNPSITLGGEAILPLDKAESLADIIDYALEQHGGDDA